MRALLLSFVALALTGSCLSAQGTTADYERAERFVPPFVDTLVLRSSVRPRWIRNGDRFWYRNALARTLEYVYVDPERRLRRPAFDHARLAAGLNAAIPQRTPLRGDSLPIDSLAFSAPLDSVDVVMRASAARCSLVTYACASIPFDTTASQAGRSPDGKWIAFVRDFHLWVRSTATGEEREPVARGGDPALDDLAVGGEHAELGLARVEIKSYRIHGDWPPGFAALTA